jgi:hypothetical protein
MLGWHIGVYEIDGLAPTGEAPPRETLREAARAEGKRIAVWQTG